MSLSNYMLMLANTFFIIQQWFTRRKQDADCIVSDIFKEPVGKEENCACTDEDFEW